ncbi:transposase [Mesorhizobium sp. ESP6-5]|uniref:transposase n=1 Tax=Mesorhizobium sp. ESP6-5 TaxID=2876623 RepID=UPI001CCEBD30|nr:transposase [Mesorhizobium sp. ESP6-5]MBZ9757300.1 transposase [Mesorhizobium sp. ESP6-5]
MDGRSNRHRFSVEEKHAIVQETEKPGVAVAQVCRRHGIATCIVFRLREEFGLTARKAPRLVTVVLADGADNEPPTFAALRDLVRPLEGMVAIELDDGRRVFTAAGTPTGVRRSAAGGGGSLKITIDDGRSFMWHNNSAGGERCLDSYLSRCFAVSCWP